MNFIGPETVMLPLSSVLILLVLFSALSYLIGYWCSGSNEASFRRINEQYRELVEDAAADIQDADLWKSGKSPPY